LRNALLARQIEERFGGGGVAIEIFEHVQRASLFRCSSI
jgi:hypothetical protein